VKDECVITAVFDTMAFASRGFQANWLPIVGLALMNSECSRGEDFGRAFSVNMERPRQPMS
jgi:hypothetical protein